MVRQKLGALKKELVYGMFQNELQEQVEQLIQHMKDLLKELKI